MAVQLQGLVIGVTTEDPETTSLPQGWDDIMRDQYWYITSLKDKCRARHKAQERELQWVLDRSAGNTIGCCVLETGELHLYHNGRDVGVAWKGLPTDQPLWGFVEIRGWKIKANYIIPKSEAMMCVVSLCSSRAMYLAVRTVSVTTPTKPMWELTQLVSLHQCMYSGHHSAICVCVYVYNVCLCLWVCVSTCMCVCRVCDVLV